MGLEFEHNTQVRADRSGQSRITEVNGLESTQIAERDSGISGSVEGASALIRNKRQSIREILKSTAKIAD